MFFHFGFGKRILVLNGIKETGWFRNSRFQSLNSKPTFLSVIIGIIITYFDQYRKDLDNNTIVIAHSIGNIMALTPMRRSLNTTRVKNRLSRVRQPDQFMH